MVDMKEKLENLRIPRGESEEKGKFKEDFTTTNYVLSGTRTCYHDVHNRMTIFFIMNKYPTKTGVIATRHVQSTLLKRTPL